MTTRNPSNNRDIHSPSRALLLAGALLLAAVLLAAGCHMLAGAYALFIDPLLPPPTVEAEYTFADKSVLVWVDQSASSEENALLRRELTGKIRDLLLEHQAGRFVVSYERVLTYRVEHPDFVRLPLEQLGRDLNADLVLHVFIENFTLHHETAPGFYRLNLTGAAKLIDANTAQRVWPAAQVQRPLGMTAEMIQGQGQHFEDQQIRKLAADLAEEIARFFYKHPQPK